MTIDTARSTTPSSTSAHSELESVVGLRISVAPVLLTLAEKSGAIVGTDWRHGRTGVTATPEQWAMIAVELARLVDDYERGLGDVLKTDEVCGLAAETIRTIRSTPLIVVHEEMRRAQIVEKRVHEDVCVARTIEKLTSWVATHRRGGWPLDELNEAEVGAALIAIKQAHVFEVPSRRRSKPSKFYSIRITPDGRSAFRVLEQR